MTKARQELINKLENLIRRHMVLFSEVTMPDAPEDLVYANTPNVSAPERAKGILPESAPQQNLLMRWMRCMTEMNAIDETFDTILNDLIDYYQAGSGFIRSFTAVETVKYISHSENSFQLPFIEQLDSEMLTRLEALFHKSKLVLIRSVSDISKSDPISYRLLTGLGIENLYLGPIFSQNQLVGLIGLGNIKQHWNGIFLLQILGDCIAATIQKKIMQEEKERILYLDSLTGHLNFEGYKLHARRFLHTYPERKYALCYCDIKRFKFINEVYGYDTGDRLLKWWGDYLKSHIHEEDVCCRISADAMSILQFYDTKEELVERFKNMADHIAGFPELASKRMHVEVACGIYLVPRSSHNLAIDEMLNRANMAQKSVKDSPGSQLAFYTEEMRRKEVREMELAINMKEALTKEEFLLYFQPQIATMPNTAIRAEVLARWERGRELVALPGEFIRVFEHNGSIIDFDRYMFEHACQYIVEMKKKYSKRLVLSVNVSKITALQPNFTEDYSRIKDKYKLSDGLIELEFTESIAVTDVEYFSQLIVKLKSLGFVCTMDDFGSGDSSLNVLQALPLDILKLDQKFFKNTQDEQRKQIIVANILKMAKQLKMLTVAEGIESAEQAAQLSKMGCDYIQGYYYSKPLPADIFEGQYLRP